jgi:hypothetical protein
MNQKEKKEQKLMRQKIWEYMRQNKRMAVLYLVLRVLVVVTMILQIFNQQYENVYLCVLTLVLLMIPPFIEVNFRIDIPDTLEVVILFFIIAAEILGEIQQFYIRFSNWDTILHTINGFLAAAIGFSLVDLLNRNDRFKFELSPVFLAIVSFCFSMTIGVLWEFFEWSMDWFFGLDMQKDTIIRSLSSMMLVTDGSNMPVRIDDIQSVVVNGTELGLGGYLDIGLMDTMEDLFVNFIGAVIFSIIGYFYVRSKGKGRFARRFIPRRIPKEVLDDIKKEVQEEVESSEELGTLPAVETDLNADPASS